MYKYINVANNVLSSVENVPQRTDDEIAGVNYVKGQAHFLRGWYYFGSPICMVSHTRRVRQLQHWVYQ